MNSSKTTDSFTRAAVRRNAPTIGDQMALAARPAAADGLGPTPDPPFAATGEQSTRTGDHIDYHQLTDEPQYIDYPHLTEATRPIADIARRLADLDHRVAVDGPKPDPKAPCRP